jgi:N-acylglucosamine 2-epimerase
MSGVTRRELLAAGGAAAAWTAAAPTAPAAQEEGARQPVSTLAGVPLRTLRGWYRRELFDAYLPFEDLHVADHELGGFMCEVDPHGTRVSSMKNAWMDGRGLWVHAFLYNRFGRDPRHLEIARKTAELLLAVGPSGPDGLWPRAYTREGRPTRFADGEIYGDLFVAEGLDEYAAATGEEKHGRMARDLLFKCVDLYDRPDYRPGIGQTYLGPEARPLPGARILGVWMVLLRVATQMLARKPDAQVEQVAERAVRAMLDHHLHPAFNLLNELLHHDLTRPDNEYAQLVYTGHAIEVLWMVLDEARRRKDTALFGRASALFRRHLAVARDEVYGGVFRNLQHVDRHSWLVDKVLWLQEEALIGLMIVVEEAGEAWAAEEFGRLYEYVTATFALRARGVDSPVWIYAADRTVSLESFRRMPARLENYHHPRSLMLNLLAIERMERGAGRR